VIRKHLGDSYDAVKRLWAQALSDFAPLFAEPRFIPEEMRGDFTRLTGIPMLATPPPRKYSILNDPDTGIRSPIGKNQKEGRTHITLARIRDQLRQTPALAVVTFDQSHHRSDALEGDGQRRAKIGVLKEAGLYAFYYVSHAPFLFAFRDAAIGETVRERLIAMGIPSERLSGLRMNRG
jgi:hypothetical protein